MWEVWLTIKFDLWKFTGMRIIVFVWFSNLWHSYSGFWFGPHTKRKNRVSFLEKFLHPPRTVLYESKSLDLRIHLKYTMMFRRTACVQIECGWDNHQYHTFESGRHFLLHGPTYTRQFELTLDEKQFLIAGSSISNQINALSRLDETRTGFC